MSLDSMSIRSSVTNAAGHAGLDGNLFPVEREVDEARLEVRGEIPARLRGTYIRNGPNPAFEPIGQYHMFDGDGMLHGFSIGDDGISYRNRWIRSKGLQVELAHGRAIYPGLGDVLNFPDRSLTGDAGPVKNPANTHVIRHAGRMLALWEGGLPTEITPELDTVGEYSFGGALPMAMTAHPRLDPRTGEMFFFAYSLFPPHLTYYAVDAAGTLSHQTVIDVPAPVMMHDFILTERYAVFMDSPVVFSPLEEIGKGPMVTWKPENGTRLGVMPRRGHGSEIRWFDVPLGHVQHFWNGWEEDGKVILSGTEFARVDFGIDAEANGSKPMTYDEAGRPTRYVIDLAAGTATSERYDDLPGDFARVNDDYCGVRTNCEYMSAFMRPRALLGDFDSIVKYDTATGERAHWTAGEHGHVGESVFCPDPAGTAEDDGWLLNVVYYDDTDHSELVILDARDVAAGPIATVRAPQRVPFGFHANWFPA